jgi:hypothetical protein
MFVSFWQRLQHSAGPNRLQGLTLVGSVSGIPIAQE